MDISLISVPIMYGCDRQGVQFGPEKLRQKGLVETIKKYHKNLYDLGNLFIPHVPEIDKYSHHKQIKFLKQIIDFNKNLAHSVFSSLSSNSFPFILGGDHSLGLGSISGSSKFHKNLAVIWVDAHADINTCETSPSGNAHGMPLAAAMGFGNPSLINVYFEGQKVKAENVYILGARDLDEGEVKLAAQVNLNLYTMDEIKRLGLKAILDEIVRGINKEEIDGVHLSFDIDSLDEKIVPGTGTPVANGFSLDDSKQIIKEFLDTQKIKSMDFVELNPFLDENDITANVSIELIDWTFKNLY